mmetsp:Transcript_22135/g.63483  ORF Transcript_22135/g.63483 Transcript_22135/m.63483 type:complete len:221 (+) Transcript_22135:1649-2311(+)
MATHPSAAAADAEGWTLPPPASSSSPTADTSKKCTGVTASAPPYSPDHAPFCSAWAWAEIICRCSDDAKLCATSNRQARGRARAMPVDGWRSGSVAFRRRDLRTTSISILPLPSLSSFAPSSPPPPSFFFFFASFSNSLSLLVWASSTVILRTHNRCRSNICFLVRWSWWLSSPVLADTATWTERRVHGAGVGVGVGAVASSPAPAVSASARTVRRASMG